MTLRNKKLLNSAIKAAILVLVIVFVTYKLQRNNHLGNFKTLLENLPQTTINKTIAIVFLLMFLNWFIEALKWRYLMRRIKILSVWQAIESVFCGLTLAVFTPNRIGEYGGRVFFLPPKRRITGIIAMGIGSVGQMVVTNVLGAAASVWFVYNFTTLQTWGLGAAVALAAGVCLLYLTFFFNINRLVKLLTKVSWVKKYIKFFKVFARYRTSELLRVMAFCLARYGVFTSQYCILIYTFLPGLSVFAMVMMIFILFFVQSALPSLDLLDIGIRSLTASYLFSFITPQEGAIIASTAFIWLVNLIIPAVLGLPLILKLNFFGTRRN